MIQHDRFSANRDQGSFETIGRTARGRRGGDGALASVLVLLGLVLASTMAIAGRAQIVSIAPPTAAAYALAGMPVNLRGLTIGEVHAVAQQSEGQAELLVTGEIANLRDGETPVPALRLALQGEDGRELYVWTARGPKPRLGAHERVGFRARLAAPPSGVRDIVVKFVEPGNKGAFTETPS
jgi:hypothetical protein